MTRIKLPLKNPRPVMSMAISPDDKLLAVGQQGGKEGVENLTIWKTENWTKLQIVECVSYEYINDVFFSPSGKLYYCSDTLGVVRYDPISNNYERGKWTTDKVVKLDISPDEKYLLCCGEQLQVWDIESGDLVWILEDYKAEGISTDKLPNSVKNCWDESSSSLLNEPFEKYPAQGVFLNNGNQVAVSGYSFPEILLQSIVKQDENNVIPCAPIQVSMLKTDTDKLILGCIGRIPKGLFLWNLEQYERHLPGHFNESFDSASCVEICEKINLLIVGTSIGYINFYTLSSGKLQQSIQVHEGTIRSIVVDSQQKKIITGADNGRVVITKLKSFINS